MPQCPATDAGTGCWCKMTTEDHDDEECVLDNVHQCRCGSTWQDVATRKATHDAYVRDTRNDGTSPDQAGA